jgi:hypothetical protein
MKKNRKASAPPWHPGARRASGFPEPRINFNEQEQSGMVAQNFRSCRENLRTDFSRTTIETAKRKVCQVANV